MKRKANQRITKIKKDKILELLEHAESISVQSATTIQPLGSDLVPYPDMERLRLWTNNYLLSGINKIFPTKVDNQGNMYLTTIVDGLPLHTKMTKTIEGTRTGTTITGKQINSNLLTTYGSPTFNEVTGVISGFSSSNYLKLNSNYVAVGTEFCLCIIVGDTSDANFRNVIWSKSMLQVGQQGTSILTYNETSSIGNKVIVSNVTTGQEIYVKTQYTDATHVTIKYSFDGVDYTTVYDNYEDARNWGSDADGTVYSFGTPPWGTTTPFLGSIDLSKSYVRLPSGLPEYLAIDTTETVTLSSETSKPGLWLSNLILPMNGDNNGYYLRHNKVHSNEGEFDTFNSDTVGNYSFTFLQRAKIAEQDANDWIKNGCDNDFQTDPTQKMYNMHFIPDRQSCVVYPSLQLWTPLFGRVYSTYQTIVTPSDPDMQFYQESDSKCVNFTNRLYSNSDELLPYSMKLVGKDWSYQFRVYGNGNGSGNDYGNGNHPDNDNGSNGGCAEGTITYKDSSTNTTCTQEINSCFQTDQSFFNPNIPNADIPSLGGGGDTMIKQSSTGCQCISSYSETSGHSFTYDCESGNPILNNGVLYTSVTSSTGYTTWDRCFDNATDYFNDKCSKCGAVRSGNIYAIKTSAGSWKPGEGEVGPDTGGKNIPVSATLYFYNPSQPQTGVNIYLNIYDLKAEAEAEGLPWTGGCGEARFTVEFSTSKCDRPGCTSRLIASNVDINSLGDISKFNNITITG